MMTFSRANRTTAFAWPAHGTIYEYVVTVRFDGRERELHRFAPSLEQAKADANDMLAEERGQLISVRKARPEERQAKGASYNYATSKAAAQPMTSRELATALHDQLLPFLAGKKFNISNGESPPLAGLADHVFFFWADAPEGAGQLEVLNAHKSLQLGVHAPEWSDHAVRRGAVVGLTPVTKVKVEAIGGNSSRTFRGKTGTPQQVVAHVAKWFQEHALPTGRDANRARPEIDVARRARLPKEALARGPVVIHDLEVYTWEGHSQKTGAPYWAAAAFVGNQGKPVWYHHYRTSDQRDQAIVSEIKQRREVKKYRASKKVFEPLRVGQVLETSWGYDQTNVDFYEVIAVRGAVVDVQEVGKSRVMNARGQGEGSDMVIPDTTFRGKVFRNKRQQGYEGKGYVRMGDSRGMATLWDGKPAYETASGWGH